MSNDIERQAFEERFPVPVDIFWNEASEQYDAARGFCRDELAEIYHQQWVAWQAARAQGEPSSGVPDGYALVPKHANKAMILAGKKARFEEFLYHEDPDLNTQGIWKAMIAAAPTPEAEPEDWLPPSKQWLRYPSHPHTNQPDSGAGDGWIRCPKGWLEEAKRDFEGGDSADHYNLLRDLLAVQSPQQRGADE